MTKYTRNFNRDIARKIIPQPNTVLISITDPETPDAELHPDAKWDAILRIKFWDVDRVWQDYTPATEKDIFDIFEFIKRHWDKNIYVHCEAGISRSGAIRQFLEDNGWKLTGPYWQIIPNKHVYQGLNDLLHK